MKSFETVYKELEDLFIQKLPEYIEKVNKEHNDGIILKPFMNKELDEDCIKLPSFKFTLDEAEYTEKDRIIENTVFEISLEINLPQNKENKIILLFRYYEAIEMAMKKKSCDCTKFSILRTTNDKLFFRLVL